MAIEKDDQVQKILKDLTNVEETRVSQYGFFGQKNLFKRNGSFLKGQIALQNKDLSEEKLNEIIHQLTERKP